MRGSNDLTSGRVRPQRPEIPLLSQQFRTFFTVVVYTSHFYLLLPVSLTPLKNIHSRISPQIFEKIQNGPIGILRGTRETDS
jgi:hypothetical protein